MARLFLSLLGGFQARLDSGPAVALPTRKAQALLAYLALSPGRAHPRDKLAALLWGGIREESARASLRQALFAIRRALGATAPVLVLEANTVALSADLVDVDAVAFEEAVAEGSPEALARAVDVYRGDLLTGLAVDEGPWEEWQLGERERLRELALEALAKVLAHQRRSGNTEPAVGSALRLLALDPLQEAVHRTLMRLYADLGRRGAALRQYQQCVSALQRDLGIEPEAETKRLYEEILRARPSPTPAVEATGAARRPAAAPPGTGLRAVLPSARKASAFVGRGAEMSQLIEMLDRALGAEGGVVAILGEAGVGKSRLVSEFAAQATARQVSVLTGRAYESEQILAFGPWVDALRAGHIAGDAAFIERLDPAWRSELARLLPELGAAPRESADQRRLFEAIVALLELLCATGPLLLVLEDLHWADEMSCRLLAFVGRRLSGWPLVVVLTARADEIEGAPALGRVLEELERDGRLGRLALTPLPRTDTDALVRSLTRTGSDERDVARLAEHAWAVSEGNAFMAIETVLAAADGSMGSASFRRLGIPERVREIVGRRLARLSDGGRALVDVAAVIGREFEFALLPRAGGLDEAATARGVEELVRRGILHGTGERFDFTHDRIRESAYTDILAPRRRLLHRRVAEAIEALSGNDLDANALALGQHYREAEVWDRAVVHLRKAGMAGYYRGANREAVACLEAALGAIQRLPAVRAWLEEAVDCRIHLEQALMGLGHFRRSLAVLSEAETIARELDDARRLGRVYARMTYNLGSVGDLGAAVEKGEQAVTLLAGTTDEVGKSGTNVVVGRAYYGLGDYRRAFEIARGNEAIAAATRDPLVARRARAFAPFWTVVALAELGDFTDGVARAEAHLAFAATWFGPHEQVVARMGAGRLYVVRGDLDRAIRTLEPALPACEPGSELATYFSRTAASLGGAYALCGRLDESLALLERAAESGASIEFAYAQPLVVATLGEARLLAGQIDAARTAATQALELARRQNQRGWEAWTLRLQGELALVGGTPDEAEARFREAVTLGDARGMRPLLAHCRLGLGGAEARRGKPDAARRHVNAALAEYRAMEMPYWIARAEAELARLP